jgi:hypothetical protein
VESTIPVTTTVSAIASIGAIATVPPVGTSVPAPVPRATAVITNVAITGIIVIVRLGIIIGRLNVAAIIHG